MYHFPFRVIRFKMTESTYEVLVTNLDPVGFPVSELKRLYVLRWGIETSFRELKHTVGLLHFHSKASSLVLQEIWARLIMYNFSAFITDREPVLTESRRYAYRANFAAAVTICRQFLRGLVKARDVVTLIGRYASPIRPDRASPRRLREKTPVSFAYRMA